MAASATDKFTKVGTGTVTSLSAPGKAIAASSINIGSATNYPTDTAVYFAIRRVDPTLVSTTNPSGVVAGTYTVWKGTVSGTIISNLALQSGGGADQVYAAGTNTQVFIDLTSAQMNSLIDGILTQHNQDGSHSAVTATSVTTSAGVTVGGTLTASGSLSGINPSKFPNPNKFSVTYSGTLAAASATSTKVPFATELYDTGNNYDNATNFRFTAPAAGFYHFDANVKSAAIGAARRGIIAIWKNGSFFADGDEDTATTGFFGLSLGIDMQLAATDYVEIFVFVDLGQNFTTGRFSGHLISNT